MCFVMGLVSKIGADVAPDLESVLETDRQPASESVATAVGLGVRGPVDTQLLTGCGQGLVLAFTGRIWNHAPLRQRLEAGGHVFSTHAEGEVLIHLLEDAVSVSGDLLEAVDTALRELDGDHAFAVYSSLLDEYVLARDMVGLKQLYYGENDAHLAFCSRKRPLWDLSIAPQRVLPGQPVKIAASSPSGAWRFSAGSRLEFTRPEPGDEMTDEIESAQAYSASLVEAVKKRVAGHRRVGVIFSGGVDSVLVAHMAHNLGAEVHCYTSGLPGSGDLDHARKAADQLGMPLTVSELSPELIELELPSIMTAIESTNHLQVDCAIPVYFAVKSASRDGTDVLLNGQGPDELFAGYSWYPQVLEEQGPDTLRDKLWDDLGKAYKETLEREEKIAASQGVELRVPYLDPLVVHTAMRISPSLKIHEGELKYLHRRVAEESGVPRSIAWRPKEAAQHGSNVHETLKAVLARLEDTLPEVVVDEPQQPGETAEELGSAYRYGGDAYANNEHYQRILDALGRVAGLP